MAPTTVDWQTCSLDEQGKIVLQAPSTDEALHEFAELALDTFFASASTGADRYNWIDAEGRQNYCLVHVDGKLAGGAGIHMMGQYYGGRPVSGAAIRCVVVAPEYRGIGVGSRMMKSVLQQLRQHKVGTSALYGAHLQLYRNAGYEVAGQTLVWNLSVPGLARLSRALKVRRGGVEDLPVLRKLEAERARRYPGHLVRNEWMWKSIVTNLGSGKPRSIFFFDGEEGPEGYIIYENEPRVPGSRQRKIAIRDLVLLTSGAAKQAHTFIADFRSVVQEVTLIAGAFHPLLTTLGPPEWSYSKTESWMLRIIHPKTALEERGYRVGVEATVDLKITDHVIEANNQHLLLTVKDGRATAEEGRGTGSTQVDIRGLASLFSGFASPEQLVGCGYVLGTQQELEALGAIFAGSGPSLADIY